MLLNVLRIAGNVFGDRYGRPGSLTKIDLTSYLLLRVVGVERKV